MFMKYLRSTDSWGLGCLIWEIFNGDLRERTVLKTPGKVCSLFRRILLCQLTSTKFVQFLHYRFRSCWRLTTLNWYLSIHESDRVRPTSSRTAVVAVSSSTTSSWTRCCSWRRFRSKRRARKLPSSTVFPPCSTPSLKSSVAIESCRISWSLSRSETLALRSSRLSSR